MTTRRSFLATLTLGGAGTGLLDGLRTVESWAHEEVDATASDFDHMASRYMLDTGVTYLNHASIGTVPRVVHEARERYARLCESNPWLHIWGDAWNEARQAVRSRAAELIGCKTSEVAINHNTTEGFNVLAAGLPLGNGDEVLFSSLNHSGASVCFEVQGKARGYSVKRFEFPLAEVPEMTAERVVELYAEHITKATKLVVFPHIDNKVGLRHPVRALADEARRRGVEFVAVDAAQSVGMIPLDVSALGVDFYCSSGHKWIQAPKETGLFYVSESALAALRPFWVTWGNARWNGSIKMFEDYGTRNLPALLAVGHAIEFQQAIGTERKEKRLRELHEHLRKLVEAQDAIRWQSPREWARGGSLVSLGLTGSNAKKAFSHLWSKRGFVFRPFTEPRFDGIRISANVANQAEELDRLVELLVCEVIR